MARYLSVARGGEMTWGPQVLFEAKDYKWLEKEAGLPEPKVRINFDEFLEELHAEFSDFDQEDDPRILALEQEVRAQRLEIDVLKCEVGALKTRSGGVQPLVDVDVSELVAIFDVQDQTELRRRVGLKPKLYAKLVEAAQQIAAFFHERPRLTFEPAAIILRIQTKLEADEADRLHDQLLDIWWLANIRVEDRMSLAIDFI